MPRSDTAIQEMREQRQARILGAAARIFARNGLTGTRIADIAAEAEMSQGLLYRYYANKEQVYVAVVRLVAQASAAIVEEARNLRGSPLERLALITHQLAPAQCEIPELIQVVGQALMNSTAPEEARRLAIEHATRLRDVLSEIICDGQHCGVFRLGNPDQLAMLYLSMIQGVTESANVFDEVGIEPPGAQTIMSLLYSADAHVTANDLVKP